MQSNVTRDRFDMIYGLSASDVARLHPGLAAAYGSMLERGVSKDEMTNTLARTHRRPIAVALQKLDRLTAPSADHA